MNFVTQQSKNEKMLMSNYTKMIKTIDLSIFVNRNI